MTVEEFIDDYKLMMRQKRNLKDALIKSIQEDDFWNAEEQFKRLSDINFQIAQVKCKEIKIT